MGFHSPLIRPAIYWGKRSFGGGTLDSHDNSHVFCCSSNLQGSTPQIPMEVVDGNFDGIRG